MALIQMNYLSKTLGMHQSLNIILPEDDSYFDPSNETKKKQCCYFMDYLATLTRI